LCSAGLAVLIQTQQTVLAAVGEDAPLSCRLLVTKDVQQVTWQKVLEKTERNIGSYSQYFGETVNPGFKDKVQFTQAGLQKNSIVIRNVTEQDAGCYLCLFNTYPDGALIAATCLEVYELHGPFIDVSRSNSPPGSVVTCSATGRPVPMVTLTVLHQNLSFSHYNTSRVSNTNGTITFTTTALLSALNTTQVGCSVSVQTAALRELLVIVPGLTETSGDGLDVEPGSSSIIVGLSVVATLLFVVCVSALISLLLRKWAEKREKENALDYLA
uniref:OX-2 membrane glycoprotein-like n=1 Tax=Xiphophorus maculatus TaxID=8083 RepID=A0A3B5R157_XIPMA